MDSRNSLTSSPPLCSNGCGFFGTAEKRNLCSKCYNDYLKQKLINRPNLPQNPAVHTPHHHHQSLSTKNQASAANGKKDASADISSSPTIKNRRERRNKKVGFTGFSCRCGKIFCGSHRFPTEHTCNFDFKKANRELLAKQNPLVMGDKLDNRI